MENTMDTETLKKKLQKQNPLMMSPMAFAIAACGGGGGSDDDGQGIAESQAAYSAKAKSIDQTLKYIQNLHYIFPLRFFINLI